MPRSAAYDTTPERWLSELSCDDSRDYFGKIIGLLDQRRTQRMKIRYSPEDFLVVVPFHLRGSDKEHSVWLNESTFATRSRFRTDLLRIGYVWERRAPSAGLKMLLESWVTDVHARYGGEDHAQSEGHMIYWPVPSEDLPNPESVVDVLVSGARIIEANG